jgi:hypothetical protein
MDTTETDFFAAWVRNDRRIGEIPDGVGRGRAERRNERLPFLLVWDSAPATGGRLRVRYRILGSPAAMALAAWYADRLDGRTLESLERIAPALEALRVLGLDRTHAVEALMIEDAARESLSHARLRTEARHERRDDRHSLESSRENACGQDPGGPT